MWVETADGEFYWPLRVDRQQDHIRVWLTRPLFPDLPRELSVPPELDGWRGCLMIDGDYIDPTRVGPFATAEEAREEAYLAAHEYLATLMAGLLVGAK